MARFVREEFTDDERARLEPHFTNLDGPVFALTNLPEVVKGALFARYSRTPKSLRRLFLDEFAGPLEGGAVAGLEGVDLASLKLEAFDGANWDAAIQSHTPWRQS